VDAQRVDEDEIVVESSIRKEAGFANLVAELHTKPEISECQTLEGFAIPLLKKFQSATHKALSARHTSTRCIGE
jgi:hypothetical protein